MHNQVFCWDDDVSVDETMHEGSRVDSDELPVSNLRVSVTPSTSAVRPSDATGVGPSTGDFSLGRSEAWTHISEDKTLCLKRC